MNRYEFNITLVGCGEDEWEAWCDAVEAFSVDPGLPDPDHITLTDKNIDDVK